MDTVNTPNVPVHPPVAKEGQCCYRMVLVRLPAEEGPNVYLQTTAHWEAKKHHLSDCDASNILCYRTKHTLLGLHGEIELMLTKGSKFLSYPLSRIIMTGIETHCVLFNSRIHCKQRQIIYQTIINILIIIIHQNCYK